MRIIAEAKMNSNEYWSKMDKYRNPDKGWKTVREIKEEAQMIEPSKLSISKKSQSSFPRIPSKIYSAYENYEEETKQPSVKQQSPLVRFSERSNVIRIVNEPVNEPSAKLPSVRVSRPPSVLSVKRIPRREEPEPQLEPQVEETGEYIDQFIENEKKILRKFGSDVKKGGKVVAGAVVKQYRKARANEAAKKAKREAQEDEYLYETVTTPSGHKVKRLRTETVTETYTDKDGNKKTKTTEKPVERKKQKGWRSQILEAVETPALITEKARKDKEKRAAALKKKGAHASKLGPAGVVAAKKGKQGPAVRHGNVLGDKKPVDLGTRNGGLQNGNYVAKPGPGRRTYEGNFLRGNYTEKPTIGKHSHHSNLFGDKTYVEKPGPVVRTGGNGLNFRANHRSTFTVQNETWAPNQSAIAAAVARELKKQQPETFKVKRSRRNL